MNTYNDPYYDYHNQYYPSPPSSDNSPFINGFSGCLGVGCAAVACITIGFILMAVLFTVAALNS